MKEATTTIFTLENIGLVFGATTFLLSIYCPGWKKRVRLKTLRFIEEQEAKPPQGRALIRQKVREEHDAKERRAKEDFRYFRSLFFVKRIMELADAFVYLVKALAAFFGASLMYHNLDAAIEKFLVALLCGGYIGYCLLKAQTNVFKCRYLLFVGAANKDGGETK